jgi:small GTP-binding protein
MGFAEKIKELEDEILRTQKNKATEHHIGLLKAKIAKLRRLQIERSQGTGGGGGGGFNVAKSGDATVALIGFPSVGKSTLLIGITNAKSKIAEYAFTTVTVIPGILKFNDTEIQVLDLPGIIEGAKEGKGRGKEIIGVARGSDMLIVILTPFSAEKEFNAIMRELRGVGIRLNERPPDITVEKHPRGGLSIIKTRKITKIDDRTIKAILNEYSIHNATVIIREDVDADGFIDAIERNRVYMRMIIVVNKVDLADTKTRAELEKRFKDAVFISARDRKGLEMLKERIFIDLDFMRVFTKPLGGKPDMSQPMMMKNGSTVKDAAKLLHRELAKNLRYCLVWGPSARFGGQRVGADHRLKDRDIITLVTKN